MVDNTAMPIYEFYCPDCHTVFSFFSSAVDTAASPACPRCSRPGLGRRPSRLDGAQLRYNQPDPYLPDLLVCRPELAERVLSAIAQSSV